MVVMVTPVAFAAIGYKTYIIFAVINAFMVPCVYFFYVSNVLHIQLFESFADDFQPETAYRSLEEIDEIFHEVHGFKGIFDVVKVAREKPRRYGKRGELLINYEDTEEARKISERRRSSIAAQEVGSAAAGLRGEKASGNSSDGVFSEKHEDVPGK